ncbi:MAG: hypothetical protein QOK39_499 [Acidimicrobiaceae bacterium]|nr:hypothetical protein [Acidimicrobiaceae bacterium]
MDVIGPNHAACGVAAYGGSVWAGTHLLGFGRLGVAQATLGAVVALGASLAPDLDEPHSMAGHANPLAHLGVFGGHRRRTHCLVAVAVVAAAAVVCGGSRAATAGLVGLAACTGGGVLSRALRGGGWLLCVPFGVAVGWACYRFVPGGWWLSAAVSLPYASHLVGDGLTPGGVPWLLPFSQRRWSLSLFRTGRAVELLLVTPAVHLLAGWAVYAAFAPTVTATVAGTAGAVR